MEIKRTNSGGPMTIDENDSREAAVKLWERQPNEDWLPFHAFTIYRDMPPGERKLVDVAKQVGKSSGTITNWAKKYKWKERTVAYLIAKDEEARIYDRFIRQEMNDRHAKACKEGLDKIVERIKDFDITTMNANEVIKWFDTLLKNERLARGASTEIVNASQTVTGTVTVNNNESITHKVVVDPEASKLACELLEKVQLGHTISPEPKVVLENKTIDIEIKKD